MAIGNKLIGVSEDEVIHSGFRIVEMKNGDPYTLFHGISAVGDKKRTRRLDVGAWLEADIKDVRDNGPYYVSGFHFMYDLDLLIKYMGSFTSERDLHIIPIYARVVSPKPTNLNIFLSKYLYIDPEFTPCHVKVWK